MKKTSVYPSEFTIHQVDVEYNTLCGYPLEEYNWIALRAGCLKLKADGLLVEVPLTRVEIIHELITAKKRLDDPRKAAPKKSSRSFELPCYPPLEKAMEVLEEISSVKVGDEDDVSQSHPSLEREGVPSTLKELFDELLEFNQKLRADMDEQKAAIAKLKLEMKEEQDRHQEEMVRIDHAREEMEERVRRLFGKV